MTERTEGTPDMGAEASADFAALAAMAEEAAPIPGTPEEQAQPARPPISQEISGLLQALAGILKPAFPNVAARYDETTCEQVGAALEPLCIKHGWLQGGVGGEWGEEIMAALVIVPLGLSTYAAAQIDLAAHRAAKDAVRSTSATRGPIGRMRVPGSDTVTVGAPIENP